MFNLIVAGNGTHWEAAPLTFGVDRFKEYSDGVADGIDIGEPETLAQLEQIPTLLVYEVGARGPRARTVRYGQLANLRRRGQNLVRSEEHTSELQSLMRISYAVFCLKKKKQ